MCHPSSEDESNLEDHDEEEPMFSPSAAPEFKRVIANQASPCFPDQHLEQIAMRLSKGSGDRDDFYTAFDSFSKLREEDQEEEDSDQEDLLCTVMSDGEEFRHSKPKKEVKQARPKEGFRFIEMKHKDYMGARSREPTEPIYSEGKPDKPLSSMSSSGQSLRVRAHEGHINKQIEKTMINL